MYFDTHAHYDDNAFDEDREELLASVKAAGVELLIDPGCDIKSSFSAQKLASEHDFVFFAAGVHPEELEAAQGEWLQTVAELAGDKKCAAIGEIGLDYYWDASRKDKQKLIFSKQIELALDMDKPIIVHDREAHGDSLDIIRRYSGMRGVFHCYSGSTEMAEELLKRNWYLGFDGPITYKNAKKSLEVLRACPFDRILIETDSPYLSPVPMRGKRNDSTNLVYVCEKIAEIKGETAEKIAEITLENGKRLFMNT